jgi:hypothetical protein
VDLRGFFRTVYRGKWILILTMAAAMGATLYWTLNAVPLYSSEVLIVIEARPSSIVRVDEAVQDISTDMAKVDTEVAVLASRGLAVRVIRELGLDKDPEFAPTASDGVDQMVAETGEAASSAASPATTYPGSLMAAITDAVEGARSFLASTWTDYDRGEERNPDGAIPELPDADLWERRMRAKPLRSSIAFSAGSRSSRKVSRASFAWVSPRPARPRPL